MRTKILIISIMIVLGTLNYITYEREQVKRHGERVLLALVPADPRSLIQGDYLRLRYAVAEEASRDYLSNLSKLNELPAKGYLVVAVDNLQVGRFRRFYRPAEPLAADERLLRYHRQGSEVTVVPDSFLFQEGQAKVYQAAKYGEFRFSNRRNPLLVGLVDDQLQPIKP
jgi:uncharacterized membrane-anchored protein